MDIGAGSGYFVGASKKLGIPIVGVEVSGKQVDFANQMLEEKVVFGIENKRIVNYIHECKANVISVIVVR